MRSNAATQDRVRYDLNRTSSSTSELIVSHTARRHASPTKEIERAVYSYIRAMRAIGRTRLNTIEIARALGISPARVAQVVQGLSKKGVKIAE